MGDVAAFLVDIFGRSLVALVSAATPDEVLTWCAGAPVPAASDDRLRALADIADLLIASDSPAVLRAWIIGTSSDLDDDAPALALARGEFERVRESAQRFATH